MLILCKMLGIRLKRIPFFGKIKLSNNQSLQKQKEVFFS